MIRKPRQQRSQLQANCHNQLLMNRCRSRTRSNNIRRKDQIRLKKRLRRQKPQRHLLLNRRYKHLNQS